MNPICVIVLVVELYLLFMIFSIIFSVSTTYDYEEDFVLDDQEPKLKTLQEKLAPLFDENTSYKGTILENIMTSQTKHRLKNEVSLSKGDKSYTINKEDIFLCLKDENNQYYNDNMLVYVLLHEISHSICDEIGHTEKFHKLFSALTRKAVELGIYNDQIPLIRDYCLYNDKKK
jgi:hypothetical protein